MVLNLDGNEDMLNKDRLFYVDKRTNLGTFNRSYAIHLLKVNTCLRWQYRPIYVYKNRVQEKENLIEIWEYYIPRKNTFNLQGQYGSCPKIDICETNMIYGCVWDAREERWKYYCIPATKEIKYFKDCEEIK